MCPGEIAELHRIWCEFCTDGCCQGCYVSQNFRVISGLDGASTLVSSGMGVFLPGGRPEGPRRAVDVGAGWTMVLHLAFG